MNKKVFSGGHNVTPLISVVIPVYNEEKNLDELLTRCLTICTEMDQTFEIVLVDDGSKDGSAQKIAAAETACFLYLLPQ